jgi:hypothetical protein
MDDSRAGCETSLRTYSRYRSTPVQCNPLAVATHFRTPAYIQSHSYWCSRERYGICVKISRIAALCTAFADNNNTGRTTINESLITIVLGSYPALFLALISLFDSISFGSALFLVRWMHLLMIWLIRKMFIGGLNWETTDRTWSLNILTAYSSL